MFDESIGNLDASMDALEALRDLSGNSEQAVVAHRTSERVEVETSVILRPGNASQRAQFAHDTVTVDVSEGGCMLLSPAPAMPGDIYWLEFSDDQLRVGSLFGRCIRGRLVREGVYELGLKFMSRIDLESAIVASEKKNRDALR